MLEVTIHGTIIIDPETGVKTVDDFIDFMSHNHNSIHDVMDELEFADDIKIIKIEEAKKNKKN